MSVDRAASCSTQTMLTNSLSRMKNRNLLSFAFVNPIRVDVAILNNFCFLNWCTLSGGHVRSEPF